MVLGGSSVGSALLGGGGSIEDGLIDVNAKLGVEVPFVLESDQPNKGGKCGSPSWTYIALFAGCRLRQCRICSKLLDPVRLPRQLQRLFSRRNAVLGADSSKCHEGWRDDEAGRNHGGMNSPDTDERWYQQY